jgi:transcriptional/translational regulatory protein YebC/TACO1
VIEAGAEDIRWRDDILEVYTKPEELNKVKEILEKKGIKIEDIGLDFVPKEEVKIEDKTIKEKIEKLFQTLDEHDDIQEIYFNLKT